VLAPTSRWPAKQWPAQRFAEFGRRLLGAGTGPIVIVGGPGERDQVAPLLDWADGEPRAVDLVGETSVARLMAVIARSSLVVANDSAALHMAVGFDRPIVALFGPTRVELVGPYRRDADVLQQARPDDRFNHKRDAGGMIERITVDQLLDAARLRLR
jgi:ADP-heptose:LPS heptosyltransferase